MMRIIVKYIPVVVAGVILFYLVYPNYEKLIEIYMVSDKRFLLLSMISSITSYLFMSLSLHEMLSILGYRIPFTDTFSITLISTTVNYFISSAGISGFALRTHLLNIRKIPVSIAITISVVLTAFIYLILGFIIMQSFFLYFFEIRKINLQMLEGFVGVIFIFAIPFFMTLIIYNHRFRNRWAIRLFYFINKTLYSITKYSIAKEDFREFKNRLNHGIKILHTKRFELAKVAGYVLLDWIFNILVLYFAFRSVGNNLSITSLVIGFSFGIVMTVIPFLPSGLGLMEFVISIYYSSYNIPVESAVFSSLVFRVFYYVVPFIISLILYYGIKIAEPQLKDSFLGK
ncbi:MAG: lysylphosphatidylglycerol synthase transmembrane domain-containing protein [Elusimicrobiales bacterium]